MSDYLQFVKDKASISTRTGFDVEASEINPMLKPHQAASVMWAVSGGRRALFHAFGLGKTFCQLEILRLIIAKTGGRALIIAPLGVRQEFKLDAVKLGQSIEFIRTIEECGPTGLYITNYETVRDGKLDPNEFDAVSLDEAAILRSYGSKTFQTFLSIFKSVKYRFVATATPGPNRLKELIHYAGFLGVMDTGLALTRFFKRDSKKANNLTLHPHKVADFWTWIASWALFLQRPSDLGFSDDGYALPPIKIIYHELALTKENAGFDSWGQGKLLPDSTLSLSGTAKVKRDTLPERVAKMREILDADPTSHYVLWHDLEDERKAIQKAVPSALPVFGTMDLEDREENIMAFSDGRAQYLSAKPVLAGSGCNFQRFCHKAIFVGIGFKFADFIQAIHRVQRFLQTQPVEIHIIYGSDERDVLQVLKTKWQQHDEMTETMANLIREHGLSDASLKDSLLRSLGCARREVSGEGWTVVNSDTVDETAKMEENSCGLIVTSIPFSNHYEYTPSYNDFGHTENNDHFWAQMDFLTPNIKRVLQPGRMYCCHVKDRILFGNQHGTGAPTVSPFHCEAITHGIKHGFFYMGMITVVTDVVRENNQTYRLGWSEQCKDGSKMGVGSPEYILLFRKPQTDLTKGYADVPVEKSKEQYTRARWQVDAHAFWRSSGERPISVDELAAMEPGELAKAFTSESLKAVYNHADHIRIGEALEARGTLPATFMSIAPGSHHPDVWHDVNRMNTLNKEQGRACLEQHVCLARGSLVLTLDGYKPIQNVSVGDLVLTHKGRWRAVQVVKNTGVRPVITIKAQGVPGLTLTPDHKLWTREVGTNAWAIAHSRKAAKKATPAWVESKDTVGSYINQQTPESEFFEISAQELWLIGRWIADGHRETRGGYTISVGEEKLDIFKSIARSYAGCERKLAATQIRLRGLSKTALYLLEMCGNGAENKEFPACVFGFAKEQARVILDGYLSGDGHYLAARNRWTASSVSKNLALGISMLAQVAYGAIASVYAGRAAGTTIIQGRTVNTKQDWIICFDIPEESRAKPFIDDGGAWKKVRSATDAGEAETWCLRVEEDESFTAEGCVVKNCPLQIDIVDRLIDRYSNPGDLVYDPFGGLCTVPFCAVKKGRAGRSTELNSGYFDDGVKYMKSLENPARQTDMFS